MNLFHKFHRKTLLLPCIMLFLFYVVFSSVPYSFFVTPASAQPTTEVSVVPDIVTENPPNTFTVNITITNALNVDTWAFKLKWKKGLLWATAVTEGDFLNKGGTQATFFTYTKFNGATPPYVDIGNMIDFTTATPVNGNGTLASVTFQVTSSGNCTLDLYDTLLFTPSTTYPPENDGYFYTTLPFVEFTYEPDPYRYPARPIVGETVSFNASASYDPDDPYDSTPGGIATYRWDFDDGSNPVIENDPITTHNYTLAGSYNVNLTVTDDDGNKYSYQKMLSVKLHDIAVIAVEVTPTEVLAGENVTISAIILNEGSTSATFNVTAYYNYNSVETKYGGSLPKDQNTTVTLTWNTANVSEGNYTIGVNAYLVNSPPHINETRPGDEQDLADNTLFFGNVTVTTTPVHDVAVTNVQVSPTNVEIGQTVTIKVTVTNKGNVAENMLNVTMYVDSTLIGIHTKVNVTAGASVTLSPIAWFVGDNSTEEGTYKIFANITEVSGDINVANNVKNITATILMLPVAHFSYSPTEPAINEIVTFNATKSYAPGIPSETIKEYRWDFDDGLIITETDPIIEHIYTKAGTYSVKLNVTDNLGLSSVFELKGALALTVGHDHDIAVVEVTSPPSQVTVGTSISINVTVENKGTHSENFTVTFYHNETVIQTQTVTNMTRNTNQTLTFTWVTTGVAEGTYVLKAVADTVSNETYTADNTRISGAVIIEKMSSSLTLTISATKLTLGESVTISGSLSTLQTGVSVTIWHKIGSGDWSNLTVVTTDDTGNYSFDWTPSEADSHAVKASWLGDESTLADESDVGIVVVEEVPAINIFLYTTTGLTVAFVVVVTYLLWKRKSKPT